MKQIVLPLALILAGCTGGPVSEAPARRVALPSTLPPMKTFAQTTPRNSLKSNAVLAQDFLDLSFKMESGRTLPILTRFEGPISVRAVGKAPASFSTDLTALLARLRKEAGLDIKTTKSGDSTANITIQTIPRSELQSYVPQAACFVVPRISSWTEYKQQRRTRNVDWVTLKKREKVAIFMPSDVAPQELRDCLHEELAQAMGPLNDLYRLPDSVFNDDNFHAVLTGFDMLMLRVYYAPELKNGMTKAQVASQLPGILARLNPRGNRASEQVVSRTPRAWIDSIETALGPKTSMAARQVAARRAVRIAESQRWYDSRYAFSLFALGRLTLGTDPEISLASFLQAGHIYSKGRDTQLQAAHVAMQMSAFALTSGQAGDVIALVDKNIKAVAEAENASLLATMLMLKAEALEIQGRKKEAAAVRLDSLGWARYGFGSERDVRGRLSEIASLTPRGSRS